MSERGRPRGFDRTKALERATELFWANGYDGTSISDLTVAMGINPPSLYAAFGSKEALFQEAVAFYGTTERALVWKPFSDALTAREAIESLLYASARAFSRRGKPRGCLVILGALHANQANKTICRQLQDYRAQNIAVIEDRLRQAVKVGELPEGLDCRAMATFYITVQQGMSILARDGASRDALLAVAQGAMAAWDGLTRRPICQ
jgi:AcrR family transcriptional regulator